MLSDRIKRLRTERGYSQTQLAKKLNLTQGAISQWETGLTMPSADQLKPIAEVFGISVDALLSETSSDPEPDDEIMQIRDRLRRDPNFRTLFKTSWKASPEHIKAAAAMLKALEPNQDDD